LLFGGKPILDRVGAAKAPVGATKICTPGNHPLSLAIAQGASFDVHADTPF
jgi:hypothetical protein